MPSRPKVRLDALIVRRGLAPSDAAAGALLLAGKVRVPGLPRPTPGALVAEDQEIRLDAGPAYVSRGGEKLAGALDALKVDPAGRDAMDVGASTGGFTDCLLQRGASRVFAVDVGTHQLHEKLRKDPRVTSREQTHVLSLTRAELPFPPSLVVADVSFIPLAKVLPHLAGLVDPGTEFVVLLKPQFEVPPKLAPGGVVKDPSVRAEAVRAVAERLGEWGFLPRGDCPSPIPGPEGNLEHFLRFIRR